jgi:hypothetical protein
VELFTHYIDCAKWDHFTTLYLLGRTGDTGFVLFPERKEGRWDAIVASGTHALDSYGLGVLIGHLFNSQIPAPLTKAVSRLQTPNLQAGLIPELLAVYKLLPMNKTNN